jgi:Uma2 family endonuclease
MARHIEDEVIYYYDSHSTEEDLMGETSFHADLVRYLVDVLTWLFQRQLCAIYDNLNFYQTANPREYPLAPDVAVIKGVSHPSFRSWRVGKSGPAPHVVFEIASEETCKKDLTEKPSKYARMGVQEYFAYDPHEFSLPQSGNRRLFGWRLDQNRQIMVEMSPRPDGSLWSPNLDSWLVPDGAILRLYDQDGQLRLTHAEAEAQRAESADQRANVAVQQTEAEARRADTAIQQAQALAEKLRSLGIDPDQLL